VNKYLLAHVPNPVLLRNLFWLATRDRQLTALLLAHIAEVEARRLYAEAGYHSMHAYCMGELRMSDDVAGKRIHAAHTARDYPAIFEAVADGRLNVSAVIMLAPRLAPENAEELLSAAAGKTRAQIEQLLADRFPQPDLETLVRALPTRTS